MNGINLGLSRIEQAWAPKSQLWKAIHVAGTNGKGSICAYLSALLWETAAHRHTSHGMFTSPYLVEPNDAIKINRVPLAASIYRAIEEETRETSPKLSDGSPNLTPFELNTLVAFKAFNTSKVSWGIVEVGLGGRLDSTNVVHNKKVTVIAKIGLDHQQFLGNTLPQIAKEKAGIMRPGVPCVADGSNVPEVLEVFRQHAKTVGAPLILTTEHGTLLQDLYNTSRMPFQAENMACAIAAFQTAFPQPGLGLEESVAILENVAPLGRLSSLDVSKTHPTRKLPILVDGAHNLQSATVLAEYIGRYVRKGSAPITWILAMSKQKEKSPEELLEPLLRPEDKIITVRFEKRDTMPWLVPVEPRVLGEAVISLGVSKENVTEASSISEAMAGAVEVAGDSPIVVAGSLYLVGDTYRAYG